MRDKISSNAPVLDVRGLVVDFPSVPKIINCLNLFLRPGEILGIVGESGSGKSVLARTLVRLEAPGKITSGSIILDSQEIKDKNQHDMAKIRGKKISLALQNPQSALDPVFKMIYQFKEVFCLGAGEKKNRAGILETIYSQLLKAGISSPQDRCRQYPHEWSRGMLQRAQLLMVFSTLPRVLILDEVTSALDPTITLQILDLILTLRKQHNTGIILISHDLETSLEICDRISVMYKGNIVETKQPEQMRKNPSHEYTRLLMSDIMEDND